MEPESQTTSLLSCPGKNQESWALDLELEDLKLLCPDGTEAGLDEYERCHLAAVPANAVVVRMEDKCRVWKYLERLQVGVDRNCIICVCVCVSVFPQFVYIYFISLWSLCYRSACLRMQVSAKLSSFFLTEYVGDARMTDTSCADPLTTHTNINTHKQAQRNTHLHRSRQRTSMHALMC